MAGYLDAYGAGDERRARIIKGIALSVVVLAVLAGILYFLFHNYPQEQTAKRFYQLLEAHNYQGAYNMWAPTDRDKADYPMRSFLQDWGPQTLDIHKFSIMDAESCGNVVIVDTDLGSAGNRKLWIKRETNALGFGPYEQCPQQNRIYNFYRNVKYQLHGRTYK